MNVPTKVQTIYDLPEWHLAIRDGNHCFNLSNKVALLHCKGYNTHSQATKDINEPLMHGSIVSEDIKRDVGPAALAPKSYSTVEFVTV